MLSVCKRESCLDCDRLMLEVDGKYVCQEFRAQYERKKDSVQEVRYEQARDMTEQTENKMLTLEQLEEKAISISDQWLTVDKKADVQTLRIVMKDAYGISLSNNRAYNLKKALQLHHAEVFQD